MKGLGFGCSGYNTITMNHLGKDGGGRLNGIIEIYHPPQVARKIVD